jgi:hypothetical protein
MQKNSKTREPLWFDGWPRRARAKKKKDLKMVIKENNV